MIEYIAYGQNDICIYVDENTEIKVDKLEFCDKIGLLVKSEGFWAGDNYICPSGDQIENTPIPYWEPSEEQVAKFLAIKT